MNFDLKANALGLVLKTIGIEPTLPGLITAFKIDPDWLFANIEAIQKEAPGFIAWAQKEAPELVKKIEGFDARIARIEQDQNTLKVMLQHVLEGQDALKSVAAMIENHTRALAVAHANDRPEDLPGYVKDALLAAAGA